MRVVALALRDHPPDEETADLTRWERDVNQLNGDQDDPVLDREPHPAHFRCCLSCHEIFREVPGSDRTIFDPKA